MMKTPTPTPAATPAPTKPDGRNGRGMPYGHEDPKRRQRLLIGSIGGVALVVALALLFIFRPWNHATPKTGGDPVKMSQYVDTPDFKKMSFGQREAYMKMMNTRKDQLAKSYADGQLSLEEYQKSLVLAHLGKQLEDMRKYFAKPVGDERLKYLDKLLTKKDAKEAALDKNKSAKEEKKEQDLLKDDVAERAEVSTWPTDMQTQYQQYREALSERKKFHKAAKEPVVPAGTPTTVPVGQ